MTVPPSSPRPLLKLRSEQVDRLREDALPKRLVRLMSKAFPEQADALGPDGTSRWVETGVQRCAELGIVKRENVTRFVHLMFLLGRENFDSAPETSWAGAILGWSNAEEDLKLAALEKRAEIEQERLA